MSPSGRPALSLSISPNERSVQSLEAEIKRLQEILVEREGEIGLLEQSLRDKEREAVLQAETPSTASTSPATPENGEVNPMMHLSPKTMNHFQELRSTLDRSESDSNADGGESLDRLNELMRYFPRRVIVILVHLLTHVPDLWRRKRRAIARSLTG